MLGFKPDVNEQVEVNLQTPLHIICRKPSTNLTLAALLLLKHGADPLARDDQGNTPFHYLVQLEFYDGWTDLVRRFLKIDGSLTVTNNNGQTVLHLATSGRNPEVLEILLQHGAEIDAKDEAGNTPLHIACRGLEHTHSSHTTIMVETLVRYGANINAKNDSQHTPIQLANMRGDQTLIQLLLKNGAKSQI